MASNESYPQHVVTAVIVAHDGAAWLPHVIDALLGQDRPVQRVVAVDTGSRDRSGAVLAGQLGQSVVFGMDRGTGYAAAVSRALRHSAAITSVPQAAGPAAADRVEWVWLLHDDCEPAPDALEQLLRGAAETPAAAVLGPKVMDWSNRSVIVEAGLTVDTAGRRVTGVEPREVDQGQHDGDRDTLAVGSAGMLVRRDIWDEIGGFDTGMALFREDVDFCWRVWAAGYRVRIITDAVVFHAQAAARRRRAVSAGRRAPYLDRRNALTTLLGNLPFAAMLASLTRNAGLSLWRTLYLLVAKRPLAALDEAAAAAAVIGHPLRLRTIRKRRAPGRRAAYRRLRADLPPGRSIRKTAEFAASALSRSSRPDTAGLHHATDDPTDDDSLLTDIGIMQRIMTHPGVLLFIGLAIVAGVAERSLLHSGPLGGGALLPAWGGASGLWREYLQAFHPTGIGSSSTAPPYLALVAGLATVLGGKPWLAVDVILLGCVPLAGLTAYLAAGRMTRSVPVRVWVAAAYALLPVATGAIAGGRLAAAAALVVIPLIGLSAGRMLTQPPRLARRAAWATGLSVAIGSAFVPLLWPVTVLAAAVAVLVLGTSRPGLLRNAAIVAIVPPVLLFPWSLQLAAHPSWLLLEAGVQQAGLSTPDLPARSLMLLSPGGPGLPPVWVTAGLALAALAALLTSRRRPAIMAAWFIAVLGLAAAVLVSRVTVPPAGGGPAIPGWPGVMLAVAAAGLLLAAAAGGDSLGRLLAVRGRTGARLVSGRSLVIALLVAAAASAPILAAACWVLSGVRGPVAPAASQPAPELVSAQPGNDLQQRTLVLRSVGGRVSFLLLRSSSPSLGDSELIPAPAAQQALMAAVAALVAPNGGEAVNQQQQLARFDIGYVLMQAPVAQALASTLNAIAGLRPVNLAPSFDLWRVARASSRVSVVEPDGTTVAVRSGPVDVSGASAPASGGILELAEPRGGWTATLNGHQLTPVASPAGSWAQAFVLPAGGGTLDISRNQLWRDLAILLEAVAVLVVAALALPGVRTAAEAQQAGTSPAADGAAEAGDSAASAAEGRSGDERDAAPSPAGAGGGRPGGDRARGRARQPGVRSRRARSGRAAAARSRRLPAAAGRVPRQGGRGEPDVQATAALDGSPESSAAGWQQPDWQQPDWQQPDWVEAGQQAPGSAGAGRHAPANARSSGGWAGAQNPAARPAGVPPSAWPASDQPSAWPPAASQNGSAGQQAAWAPGGDDSGWAAGGDDSGWAAGGDDAGWAAGGDDSGWAAAGGDDSGWAAAGGDDAGWAAGGDDAGWAAGGDDAGWAAGGDETAQWADQELEPLPSAGEPRADWPPPAADRAGYRWPAPDRDADGDDR